MFENIIEFLSNPLYNLFLATIIGIVSNLLTDNYLARTKRLWWGGTIDCSDFSYFNETKKLRITYKGLENKRREIDHSLSALRFVFWSSGKDTLNGEDISTKEPLIITLNQGVEILEIRHIASSNVTIQSNPLDKYQIHVKFEYLKKNQGAVFDIIALGTISKAKLVGVLKNGEMLTKELKPPFFDIHWPFFPESWKPRIRIVAAKWLFAISFIISVWLSLTFIQTVITRDLPFQVLVFAILFASVPLSYALAGYQFWITPIIPVELAEFYEQIGTINE